METNAPTQIAVRSWSKAACAHQFQSQASGEPARPVLDLEPRREGDVLGSVQSGRQSGLRLLSLLRHEEIIANAQVYAG
jgi:hypothetical protein